MVGRGRIGMRCAFVYFRALAFVYTALRFRLFPRFAFVYFRALLYGINVSVPVEERVRTRPLSWKDISSCHT